MNQQDRITLTGLRAFGRHGVLPQERTNGQEFIADVALWLDTRAAAAADDLSLTVDYAGLADRVASIIGGEPVALIETLAQRLAEACLGDGRVSQVEVTVHKPHAPVGVPLTDVSVTIRRSRRRVVLALGSNLGDRLANLQLGADVLAADPGFEAVAVSRVFETRPVGGPDQPGYLNAVLLADSALPARVILDRCHAAEHKAGRVRTVRWGPRTLDVDIIACGDEVSADPVLTLPHPRAHERAFVLLPWLDVDPDAVLPGNGSVAALLAGLGSAGVQPSADLALRIG